MTKINVLIADGRKLLREGMSALLKHTEVRIIGEADHVQSASKLIEPLGVDLVLLNLTQLLHTSSEAVQTLTKAHPRLRVIVSAENVSARAVREILKAGAMGCLTKECASAELLAAIRAAMLGKRYLSADVIDLLAEGYVTADRRSGTRALAPREQEILCRIASGQSGKEIAKALNIASKTVDTHRRRLMHKLDRHSVAELTHYAVTEGFIPLGTHC